MTVRVYLTALITVASVSAVASAIAAEGKTKKYVNFILSLVVMLTLLAPLGEVLGQVTGGEWLPPADSEVGDRENTLLEVTEEVFHVTLCEALSLPPDEVRVHIDGTVGDAGEVSIHTLTVTLSGDSRGARDRVWDYLNENAACPVRVAIDGTA